MNYSLCNREHNRYLIANYVFAGGLDLMNITSISLKKSKLLSDNSIDEQRIYIYYI